MNNIGKSNAYKYFMVVLLCAAMFFISAHTIVSEARANLLQDNYKELGIEFEDFYKVLIDTQLVEEPQIYAWIIDLDKHLAQEVVNKWSFDSVMKRAIYTTIFQEKHSAVYDALLEAFGDEIPQMLDGTIPQDMSGFYNAIKQLVVYNLIAASPAPGSYQGLQTVSISCNTVGAKMYYTLDGSNPGTGSTQYTGPVKVEKTATLKVIAEKNGTKSEVHSFDYKITGTDTPGGGGGGGGGSIPTDQPDDVVEPEDMVDIEDEQQSDPPQSRSFTDLTGHWAAGDVQKLVSLGIVTGVSLNEFEPNRSITRAEFTALLVRAVKLETDDSLPARFADVTADKWYFGIINTAAEAGLVSGFDQNNFGPNEPVTREQMAVMIIRAMINSGKSMDINTNEAVVDLMAFIDGHMISEWAVTSMASAIKLGIISGRGEAMIAPGAVATRAEAAVMILRMCKHL